MINEEKIKDCGIDNVIYMAVTDSTNNDAKRCDMSGKSIYIADLQTAGRGRMGHNWCSDEGGVYFSLTFISELPPGALVQLTAVAGLAAARLTGGKIKWTNDIILNGKKVCGILCESTVAGDRIRAVIGVGINNKSFPAEIEDRATSLFSEYGREFDKTELICGFLNEFLPLLEEFSKGGFEMVRNEYKNTCINIGKKVRATISDNDITGIATDIGENGELIVDTGEKLIKLMFGEVSVRGENGYF